MWTRPESSSASKRHARGGSPPTDDSRYSDPRYSDTRYGDRVRDLQAPGNQSSSPAPSPSKTKGYWFGSPIQEPPVPNSSAIPSPSKSKFAGHAQGPPLPPGAPENHSASTVASRLSGYGSDTKRQSPPLPGVTSTRDSPSPGRSKFAGYTSGSSPSAVSPSGGESATSPPPAPLSSGSGRAVGASGTGASTWWSPTAPVPPKQVPLISPPDDALRLPPPASDPWQGTRTGSSAGIGTGPSTHSSGHTSGYTGGAAGTGYAGGHSGDSTGGANSSRGGLGAGGGMGIGRGVGMGSGASGSGSVMKGDSGQLNNRAGPQGTGGGAGWGTWGWAGSFFSSGLQGAATAPSGSSPKLGMQGGGPPASLGYADVQPPSGGRTTKPMRLAPLRTPSPLSRGDRGSWWALAFSPWYATADRRKLDEGDSLSGSGRRGGQFYGHGPDHTPRGLLRRDAVSNAALRILMAGLVTLACLCSLRLYSLHFQGTQGTPSAASLAGCERGLLAYRGRAGSGYRGSNRALSDFGLGGGVGGAARRGRTPFGSSCAVPVLLAPQTCSAVGPGAGGTPGEAGAEGRAGGVGTGTGAGAGAMLKKLPAWVPQQDRFLLVTCFRGRASNRHTCLKRTLVVAALLNRTAIIPEDDVCPSATPKLSIRRLYDLPHLQRCLNAGIKEGAPKKIVLLPPGQELKVSRLFCEGPGCPGTKCVRPKVQMPSPTGFLFKQSLRAVIGLDTIERTAEQTEDTRVLALGDLFYTVVEDFDVGFGIPLAPMLGADCSPLLRPPPEIYAAAAIFSEVYLGRDYAALHLKRSDMRVFCAKAGCDFPSLGGAADCVARQMESLGLRQLFLATDGGVPEVYYLEKLLINRGIMVSKFPFERSGVTDLSPVENLLVDKLLCAQARAFVFQSSSTFALQVYDLRADMGLPRCRDRDVGPFRDPKWVDDLFSYDAVVAS